jgi:5-formyltetrahydrofolate cyclo-ligase
MDQLDDQGRSKAEIRRSVKAAILSLDPAARAVAESHFANVFPGLPGFAEAGIVLLYARAFAEELETTPFFEHALELDKEVACPRVDRHERRLRLYRIREPGVDLRPGTMGIPEPRRSCPEIDPDQIDWALVPGLAFDLRCHRLGRGAGYYDRLLPLLRRESSKWAVAFDCQLVQELPVEPHDFPLDGIATPGLILERHGNSEETELG